VVYASSPNPGDAPPGPPPSRTSPPLRSGLALAYGHPSSPLVTVAPWSSVAPSLAPVAAPRSPTTSAHASHPQARSTARRRGLGVPSESWRRGSARKLAIAPMGSLPRLVVTVATWSSVAPSLAPVAAPRSPTASAHATHPQARSTARRRVLGVSSESWRRGSARKLAIAPMGWWLRGTARGATPRADVLPLELLLHRSEHLLVL